MPADLRMRMSSEMPSVLELLARKVGFSSAGVAAVPRPGSPDDQCERERFTEWVEAGRAGSMEYLKRRSEDGALLRSSLRIAVPWARSVIVCAANYNADAPHSTDPAAPTDGWIARYAWSARVVQKPSGEPGQMPSDYHKVLLSRMRRLEAELKARFGQFESRCYVDTGPVVERVYARYAGLGWTGKNTCLLNQKLGSWMFLAVMITDLELASAASLPAADRCGSCTRCIDACPTQALVAPRQMDASRCISYLTIEHRGIIPEELRRGMGRQVFGCDICQDVCPWNHKAPVAADPELAPRAELVNPALAWLATISQEDFGRLFYGSPVKRMRHPGLRRNTAIAMGNSGSREFLPRLREWAASEAPEVADSAAWAIRQIEAVYPPAAPKPVTNG